MASKSPELLSEEQRLRLGNIPEDLTEEELARYYTLTRRELDLVKAHHEENWLGFAVQIGVLHFPGIAWRDLPGVPLPVVAYLAEQLGTTTLDLTQYARGINTADTHLDEICDIFGYRHWSSAFIRSIRRAMLPEAIENDQPLALVQATLSYLRSQKILIPALSTVEGIVWRTRRTAERYVYQQLIADLDAYQRQALTDALKPTQELKGRTRLYWLRRHSKKASARSLRQLLARLIWLDKLALPAIPPTIPLNRVRALARRCAQYKAQPLSRFAPTKHRAWLYCYLTHLRRELIDQSIEMFGAMKADLWRRGEKRQDEHIQQHAKDANQNLLILTEAMEAFLKAYQEQRDPFQAVFAVAPPETLQAIVEANLQIARPPDMSIFDLVEERYADIRAAWLKWFVTLLFRPVSGYHPAINSLRHVILLRKRRLRVTEITQRLNQKQVVRAPLAHIPSERWRKLIVKDGQIQPNFYELCAFETLHTGILSGQVAVEGSYRHQAFDSYLIPYPHWQSLRDSGQTRLAITGSAQDYMDSRLVVMQALVDRLGDMLGTPDCPLVVEKDGSFKLPRLESGIPQPARQLQRQVDRYFPQADLPDAIIDVDAWTGCLDDFTHLETGEPLAGHDKLILIATLMTMGMNMSFHRMAMATPFTYKQMAAMAAWYIREETVLAAQTRLDTFILRQPFAQLWGRGTAVSSDGMRFPVLTNVAHTQHNPHFLGTKRGTSLYSHTLDIWSPLGQQLIPPNDREALYTIDMLEQYPPEFRIFEHYTDTAGFAYLVFALSALLGYLFSPRLRDILDQSLFSLPGLKVKPPLSNLFKGRTNSNLLTHQWDDMLWSGASIRHGYVSASLLMQKLTTYPRRSPLAKGHLELGKVEKTLFALRYFSDEPYERRIEGGLNKGESIQGMGRATFQGQRGELRTVAFQEQLHRTSTLMFLVSLMCAWNTVYLYQIRAYFHELGESTDDALWQQISPARWKHFNMIGHYLFDLNHAHPLHSLRPLRFNAPLLEDDDMD